MRVPGHARFSAVTTGSTCTASPSADSITMATSRGGVSSRSRSMSPVSPMQRLPERDQLDLAHRLTVLLLELLAGAVHATLHRDAPVCGHVAAQPGAIEVDDPRARRFGITCDQDVAEVQVRVQQTRVERASEQRTGGPPCGDTLSRRRAMLAECQRCEVDRVGHVFRDDVSAIDDAIGVDRDRDDRGRLDVVLAHAVADAQLGVRPRLAVPDVPVTEQSCDCASTKRVAHDPRTAVERDDASLAATAQRANARLLRRPFVQRTVFDQRMTCTLEGIRTRNQCRASDVELTVSYR